MRERPRDLAHYAWPERRRRLPVGALLARLAALAILGTGVAIAAGAIR